MGAWVWRRHRRDGGARLVLLAGWLFLLLFVLLLFSCGGAEPSAPTTTGAGSPADSTVASAGGATPGSNLGATVTSAANSTATSDTGSGATAGWSDPSAEVLAAFAGVAEQDLGFELLVPRELPPGATPAENWRPLDTEPAPGEPRANPHVSGSAGQREFRMLLEVFGGWIEIVEGLRGDLGDLPHDKVTLRGGITAGLYRVLGGYLVQWQEGEVSFAVFVRGLEEQVALGVADALEPRP